MATPKEFGTESVTVTTGPGNHSMFLRDDLLPHVQGNGRVMEVCDAINSSARNTGETLKIPES